MSNQMIRPLDGQPELCVLDDRLRVLATLEQTSGQYEMFLVEGPCDSGPPPHSHPWEEAFYVIEGELYVQIGETAAHVMQGAYVRIPENATHTFRVTSAKARFLALTLCSKDGEFSAERFFRAMHSEIPHLPPSFDAVAAVAERNGVKIGG